ncbi:hypothetical protein Dimus_012600 [Dionaea muscipula]
MVERKAYVRGTSDVSLYDLNLKGLPGKLGPFVKEEDSEADKMFSYPLFRVTNDVKEVHGLSFSNLIPLICGRRERVGSFVNDQDVEKEVVETQSYWDLLWWMDYARVDCECFSPFVFLES